MNNNTRDKMVSGDSAPEEATTVTVTQQVATNTSLRNTGRFLITAVSKHAVDKLGVFLADKSPPSALYQVVTSTHTASECNQVQYCSYNINTATRYLCLTLNRDPDPEPPTTVAGYSSRLGDKVLL